MMGEGTSEGRALAAAILAAAVFAEPAAAAGGIAACPEAGKPFFSTEAVGARDGATIRLADGHEVRLAGIAAPTELEGDADAVRRGTAALEALIVGRRISLHGTSEATDRYGRLVAQVAIEGEPAGWVQAALVRTGAVRVAPGAGTPDCAKMLLALEGKARRTKLGVWAVSNLAVQWAGEIPTLLAAAGRYAVVEGTVRRVGEAGGRVFLDFGRRYSRDFTIVIPREAQAAFAAGGVDLRGLSGKRVRARGVLFSWGGPALELRVPAALELIGAGGA